MTTTQMIRLLCHTGKDFNSFEIGGYPVMSFEKAILRVLDIAESRELIRQVNKNPFKWRVETKGTTMLIFVV